MANKPSKKTTTAKKQTVKKTVKAAPEMENAEMHECACGHNCKCGCHSGCAHTFKKIIIAAIIFALGFAAAQLWNGGCEYGRGYRMQANFVNGCMDVTSVTCPALLEKIPTMDLNKDGCIDKDEYRAVRKEYRAMRRAQRDLYEARQEVAEEMREAREEVREEMREAAQELQEARQELQQLM